MVLLLVSGSLAIAVWFAWGLLLRALLVRVGFAPSARVSLDALALPGLAALTTLAACASLAVPLGPGALVALCLPLVALFFRPLRPVARADLTRLATWAASWGPVLWLLFALFAAIALWYATGTARNFDSGLYHLSAIDWVARYRVVPGLANLHPRLGFNNQWFLLVALLRLPWPSGPVDAVNTALYLVLLTWGLDGLARLRTRRATLSAVWRIVGLVVLVGDTKAYLSPETLILQLSSPSPDNPVMLVAWWVLGECLERAEATERTLDMDAVLPAFVAVVAVTLKLAVAPLGLAALWLLWARDWSVRRSRVLVALGALAVLPWLARNWILSGWPLYPLPILSIGHPDWQAPTYELALQRATITAWARQPGTYYDTVLHLKTSEWLAPWWDKRASFDRIALCMIMASPVLLLLAWLVGRVAKARWTGVLREAAGHALVFSIMAFVGSLYWFKNAPDPRFGYGFLVPAAVAGLLPWTLPLVKRWGRTAPAVVVLALAFYGVRADVGWEASSRWWRPAPYPTEPASAIKSWSMPGLSMPVSATNQCWTHPPPCTCSDCFNPRWEARGASLADGFRLRGEGPAADEHDPFFGRTIPAEYR